MTKTDVNLKFEIIVSYICYVSNVSRRKKVNEYAFTPFLKRTTGVLPCHGFAPKVL